MIGVPCWPEGLRRKHRTGASFPHFGGGWNGPSRPAYLPGTAYLGNASSLGLVRTKPLNPDARDPRNFTWNFEVDRGNSAWAWFGSGQLSLTGQTSEPLCPWDSLDGCTPGEASLAGPVHVPGVFSTVFHEPRKPLGITKPERTKRSSKNVVLYPTGQRLVAT